MNITIEHDSKTYVVKQGCKYGWTLEVCTPTVKEGAKKKENKESYFFPNLELVAKKLTWFEVDTSEVRIAIDKSVADADYTADLLRATL
jgi:hypothetical protein